MRIVYKRCCGMDVHKNSVTACVLVIDGDGEFRKKSRYFSTMTRDLKEMATWLANLGVEAIAMEATGVYWKPVWNILEAEKKYQLLLVNAHHVKHVPGRKTDQKDSEWIAELLQHGLLKGSFVPPESIRRLRDLTRTRAKIGQNVATFANRIQKVLEDANVKLGSVATDVLGLGARDAEGLDQRATGSKATGAAGTRALAEKTERVAVGFGRSFHRTSWLSNPGLAGVGGIWRGATSAVGSGNSALTPAGAGTLSTGRFRDRRGGHRLHASNQFLAEGGGAVGYDPRRRQGNSLDVGSGNGSQHGSVWQRQPVGEMGRDMSRQ